jgi:hypothetical protein
MKPIFKILLFCAVTLFFSSCDKNENAVENEILSESAKIELKRTFYDSSINLISPDKTNVKFSVVPVNSVEINYLFNSIVKNEILKQDVKVGFINGFAIYHNDSGIGAIKKEDIFAFSIYDIKEGNQIVHRFYTKEKGTYILKKELTETFISTENQNFLIWKYYREKYIKSGVVISRVFNVEDTDLSERRENTRNEFNLFRIRHKYPSNSSSLQKNNDDQFVDIGLNDCSYASGCSEVGNGSCSGGYYCALDGDCPICEDCRSQESVVNQSLVSETVADVLFDLDLHRRLRDDFLNNYSLGQKHIDYYYAISEFVLSSDYNTSTFLKMIETLPSFNQSVNKLLNDNTSGTEILITEELRNDMESIINDFKLMSDNEDFQFILDDLKNDVKIMTNKSKNDLIIAFE